jgi:hypothetical protein
VKNWNCDNDKCTNPNGQVRLLPTGGDGAVIVCRSCFEHEMRWRQERIRQGVQFDLPTWDSLKVYPEPESEPKPYQPKTGKKCGCRPGIARDNCPACEGTGWRIDFAAIRARNSKG